jgi:cytochrome c-type biogenesis protein CcmH/NrfG
MIWGFTAPLSAQSQSVTPKAPIKGNTTEKLLQPEEIFAKASANILVVKAYNSLGENISLGSGVAIGGNQVVTNAHVVNQSSSLKVFHGKQEWDAVIERVDWDKDICLLTVKNGSWKSLNIINSSILKIGQRVYAIGAPEGLELSLSEGLISSLRNIEEGSLIQTTAPISHGSSGGGLFDSKCNLVGITTFSVVEGQNLNFALPGELILALKNKQIGQQEDALSNPASQDSTIFLVDYAFKMMDEDNYGKAAECLQKATKLSPDDDFLWELLGFAYSNCLISRDNDALRAYETAIKLNPKNARAYVGKGTALFNLGKVMDGDYAFRTACSLDPSNWSSFAYAYYKKQYYSDTISVCKTGLEVNPQDTELMVYAAMAYHMQTKHVKAIELLKKALETEPSNTRAMSWLIICYASVRDFSQALKIAKEKVRINPNDADSWDTLGSVYASNHMYEEAIEAFREALKLASDQSEILLKLGMVFSLTDNRDGARKVYDILKGIDSKNASFLFDYWVLPNSNTQRDFDRIVWGYDK